MKIYNPSARLRLSPGHAPLSSLHEISEQNRGEPLRELNTKTQAMSVQEDVELMECDISPNDNLDDNTVRLDFTINHCYLR